MNINFHQEGEAVTEDERSEMQEKLESLEKFTLEGDNPVVDVYFKDESGSNKGGVDKAVHLSVLFGKEKVFIEEAADSYNKAFIIGYQRLKQTLERRHGKKTAI